MASLLYHLPLLDDARRTRAFDRALKESIRPGDVVADLGCGTGILSLLALKHGASRVYAVEEHPIAEVARLVAKENGIEDRLRVVRGRSQEVRLPERVDVVVSETLGNAVLDEEIVGLMADARRRFLKPGGRMVPARMSMVAAPGRYPPERAWRYGVKLETVRALSLHTYVAPAGVRRAGPAQVLWKGRMGERVRLPLDLRGRWSGTRADGVVVWFESRLSPSVKFRTFLGSSWGRAFFPSREPLRGRVDFLLRYVGGDRFIWSFNGQPAQDSTLADEMILAQLSLNEDAVPRLPAARSDLLRTLSLVDGRRTVAQIARRLKGIPYEEAVRRVKSLCLNEKLTW
jgi:protein arginine N-methyltransferase 1